MNAKREVVVQPNLIECPHWQRATADGRCITKWWAGPPVTWLVGGIAAAVGAAAFGFTLSKLVGPEFAMMLAGRNPGRKGKAGR